MPNEAQVAASHDYNVGEEPREPTRRSTATNRRNYGTCLAKSDYARAMGSNSPRNAAMDCGARGSDPAENL